MRILFDQGTPVPLRQLLLPHEVETVFERGWHQLQNGELLAVAEANDFDTFITTDQNLRNQQNLTGLKIGIEESEPREITNSLWHGATRATELK